MSRVNVVPASQWTQAERGSSRVDVAGIGDKRQITITVAGTMSGQVLPFQVLYEGKTERCHPSNSTFPEGFDIWHTPNHWANAQTSIRFIENIIVPYVVATRKSLGLGDEHMAVVIFDCFKGHKGDEMESILLRNNILAVIVLSNYTDLQPLDLLVNKPLKDHLRSNFQAWYSEQVSKQLQDGKEPEDVKVDTQLSIMKPLGAKWITSAYDYLRRETSIIHSGFVKASIVAAIENETLEADDPFEDLD